MQTATFSPTIQWGTRHTTPVLFGRLPFGQRLSTSPPEKWDLMNIASFLELSLQ